MNKRNALLLLVLGLLLVLSMTGCWNRRELNTFSILMGMGVDKAESGKVQLTAQVVKVAELKKDGGGSDTEAYLTVRSIGDTVFDALRNFTKESTRKIYLPHNQIIIFGEEIAAEGVHKYTDFFARDHEPRLRESVLVARGKAEDILKIKSEVEKIPAVGITSLLKAQAATSEAMEVPLKDFICCLMSNTKSPVAPLIEVVGEGEEKSLHISGMAIFKQDRLVGELINKEARGLLWVLGKVKSGIIVIDCADGEDLMGLEIIEAGSKIIPEIKGDKLSVTVEIKEEGHIGDQECLIDLTLPTIAEIEQKKASVIRAEVMAAWEKAQELNTDVFGFGEAFRRKYPREWEKMEGRWDYIFPELEVEVKVDAKIRRSGALFKPTSP